MKVIATYTVLIAVLLLPLFIMAETIIVKTKAPQNRNAVFQYRVPKGYDKFHFFAAMPKGICTDGVNFWAASRCGCC